MYNETFKYEDVKPADKFSLTAHHKAMLSEDFLGETNPIPFNDFIANVPDKTFTIALELFAANRDVKAERGTV